MKKIVKLKESDLVRIIKESLMREDLDYNEFKNDANLQSLRDALSNNRLLSVAFVKKSDNTVKHMLIRKTLPSYQFSEKEKTEKQANMSQNTDVISVIDMNAYIKNLRQFNGDKAEASKLSWRRLDLKNVLGFMVNGSFIDTREGNNILARFGQQVYDSLTPRMVTTMEAEQNPQNEAADDNL